MFTGWANGGPDNGDARAEKDGLANHPQETQVIPPIASMNFPQDECMNNFVL
ncbi:hypothetical protein GLI01_05720 [Gluconacetobacter liquefaciens]|nr:hypothetical protein GLI01_05720 [Gluconacetobacter liquefaciens]